MKNRKCARVMAVLTAGETQWKIHHLLVGIYHLPDAQDRRLREFKRDKWERKGGAVS